MLPRITFPGTRFLGGDHSRGRREAKVDTALLHYYFDTKRGLFDAVFRAPGGDHQRERIASIDAYVEDRPAATSPSKV